MFPKEELSFKMNKSQKLMTPLGLHREIHPVMRDTGALQLLYPLRPPYLLAPRVRASP